MKIKVKVEELKTLMPSTRSMIYVQIVGLHIFLIAFICSSEEIIYTLLLLIGAAALTEGFEKTRMQKKLKEIME